MKLKQFSKTEEYYGFLEKEIERLFKKQGIGICKDRYCGTITYLTTNKHNKIAEYCRRLIQGGVYIYICNDSNEYPLLSNVTDDKVEGLYIFDEVDVKKAISSLEGEETISAIVNQLMHTFNEA